MASNPLSFLSLNLESKFISSGDLKEIKQMLLSGDKQLILQSVEKIKFYANNEKCLVELLRSDIAEFLCDAIAPFDADSVQSLFSCLECMTKHVEFFSCSHSSFTVESLLRSIYFSVKNSTNMKTFDYSLNLLVIVIQGYHAYELSPEKKTVVNLLHLLPLLLKMNNTSVNNKYQIGNVILGLIDSNLLESRKELYENVLSVVASWLDLITDILESLHPFREKIIALSCTISCTVLRFVVTKSESEEQFVSTDYNIESDLLSKISHFVVNYGAPYFNSVPLSFIENDPSNFENFFETLLFLFSNDIITEKKWLAHSLCEMGFLQFITRVISVEFIRYEQFRVTCILILGSVILTLSEDVFSFGEVWPGCRSDFDKEIREGFLQLPLDPGHWLDFLSDPHSPPLCKLTLLLYLYFFSMTAKSQEVLETIYPSIVNFINASHGVEFSDPLVKIVWFVYAISQMSCDQNSCLDIEMEAKEKMVAMLEAQDDLSVVYTHHPALLYWVFSSKINRIIQCKIVQLWLRNKTSDCTELEDLIRNSSDARFTILEILQTGWGQVLESAFLTLKTILLGKDGESVEELASNIWFLLPQVLAKYTTDSTSATNVDFIIELSSLKTPRCLDITRVIRIASLLSEIFTKSDLISISPSLSLIIQLLELGFQMEDSRVIRVFLRFVGFLQKIMEGINASVSYTSLYSLKIVALLWTNCNELDINEYNPKVQIKKEVLTKSLENNCVEVVSAALDLVEKILFTGFRSPVFEIEEVDSDFMEILFLDIQHICIKNFPEITSKCWRCLRLFLNAKPIGHGSISINLFTNPLLHELINFHLIHLKDNQEMKGFLSVWVDQNNKKLNDSCCGRKIFGGFYLETVRGIASSLSGHFGEDDQVLYEKVY